MTVREYIKAVGGNITFTICRPEKDEHSPFYHEVYTQTPARIADEWLKWTAIDDYLVLNPHHAPLDFSGSWDNWYRSGDLNNAVIVTRDDWKTLYKGEQGDDLMVWYDTKTRNAITQHNRTGNWFRRR